MAFKGTTIIAVKRNGTVAIAGDGQVTAGDAVMKGNARKIRKMMDGKIISGFINDPMGTYAIEKRGESPYSYLLSRGYQDTFGNKISLNWNFDYKMDFIIVE